MKIGVFDSGVGGLSVANAIRKALPEHEIIYVEDKEHVPYGDKTPEQLLGFVVPIFQKMIADGCEVIVVACNTVSTTLIGELRGRVNMPLIAMEPMVKPAATLTRSKKIIVCATPTTLASDRYKWLKDNYAHGIETFEPDCSQWSYLIEHNQLNIQEIHKEIEPYLQKGADVIVLGCTHYHWIEDEIRSVAAGRAQILQPEQPVIKQLKRVITQLV